MDDLRESPAIEVCRLLSQAGALVQAYEPYKKEVEVPGIKMVGTLEAALSGADAVLVLVAHSEFKAIDPRTAIGLMRDRNAVDTVGIWEPRLWQESGFEIHRLGVGQVLLTSESG